MTDLSDRLTTAREALADCERRVLEARARIASPKPDDDPEDAHRDLRAAEWTAGLARANVNALALTVASERQAANREEYESALERSSLIDLWDRTESARANVVRAYRDLVRSFGEIVVASQERDAAAERAVELAAQLGEQPPQTWGRLGWSAVGAQLLEDLASEPAPPVNLSVALRVLPSITERAHAQLAPFGSPFVASMSPEQVAAHILEHGTDPRPGASAEQARHERAAKAHLDRLARAKKLRAERELKEQGERVAREMRSRSEALQRATHEQNQQRAAESARSDAELLAALDEHERQMAATNGVTNGTH